MFADSKTMVDCLPKTSWEAANAGYLEQRDQPGFDLSAFVLDQFDLPHVYASDYKANRHGSVEEHIESLWPYLTREPESDQGSLMASPIQSSHCRLPKSKRWQELFWIF